VVVIAIEFCFLQVFFGRSACDKTDSFLVLIPG
jgi:hypothetical protein